MSIFVLRWSEKPSPLKLGWVAPLGETLVLEGESESVNTINEFPNPALNVTDLLAHYIITSR